MHELLRSNVQAQAPSGPDNWDGELFKGKVKGTSEDWPSQAQGTSSQCHRNSKMRMCAATASGNSKNGKTPELKCQEGTAVLTHVRWLSKDEADLVLMGQLRNHSHHRL